MSRKSGTHRAERMAFRLKVVGLGDSTTAGTPGFMSPIESPPGGKGNEQSQYAYWMMKDHPDWLVLNRGVNGERSDEVLERFERDVARESPRITIILAGVNDIYQGRPVDAIQKNLASMFTRTAEIGASPVGCSVLPYNTMTAAQATTRRDLNSWIEEECRRRSIEFCDTSLSVCSKEDPDRLAGSPDGLHPDVAGYRAMAGVLAIAVDATLAVGRRDLGVR